MPEAGDPVIEAALLAFKQEVLWWFWTTDAVSAHLPLNNAGGIKAESNQCFLRVRSCRY
jgi:hypothetical protein